jgi:hypothetical protein
MPDRPLERIEADTRDSQRPHGFWYLTRIFHEGRYKNGGIPYGSCCRDNHQRVYRRDKMLPNTIPFSPLDRRQIAASFTGGDITSHAGFLLLRAIIQKTCLARKATSCLNDNRRQSSVQHQTETLLTQRLMALCAGYEYLNDHDRLKLDKALQVACGQSEVPASSPTLCRLERQQDRSTAIRLHGLLLDQFFKSHPRPPKSLVLDFDATDIPLPGEQEQRFFHGYYNHYCFLPLYVFCGRHLLVSYLRHTGQGNPTPLVSCSHHIPG